MVEAMWQVGPVTSLVNNAAANFIAPTKGLSPRGFRAITSTVMDGSFHVTLALGKRWIDECIKGAVVSNLVTWVWTGSAFVVPSAMAKTALHAMTMRSEEHTSELQSLMRISYAVFCLKKKNTKTTHKPVNT